MFKKVSQLVSGHKGGDGEEGCVKQALLSEAFCTPDTADAPLPFLFISIHNPNVIRYGPRVNDAVTSILSGTIKSLELEVKEFGDYRGVVQWQFMDKIFSLKRDSSHELHLKAIRLINQIIEDLNGIGWHLCMSPETYMSNINFDNRVPIHYQALSDLCFAYETPTIAAQQRRFLSIEAHSSTRLLIVNAPVIVTDLVERCAKRAYAHGHRPTPYKDASGADGYELEFNKEPFHRRDYSSSGHAACMLVGEITRELRAIGVEHVGVVTRNVDCGQRPTLLFSYDAMLDAQTPGNEVHDTSSNLSLSTIAYVDQASSGDALTVFPADSAVYNAVCAALDATQYGRKYEKSVFVNDDEIKQIATKKPFKADSLAKHADLMRAYLRIIAESERNGMQLIGQSRHSERPGLAIASVLYFAPSPTEWVDADYLAITPNADDLNATRLGALFVDLDSVVKECVRLSWKHALKGVDGDLSDDERPMCSYKLKGYYALKSGYNSAFFSDGNGGGMNEIDVHRSVLISVLISMIVRSDPNIECLGAFHLKLFALGGDTFIFRRKKQGKNEKYHCKVTEM